MMWGPQGTGCRRARTQKWLGRFHPCLIVKPCALSLGRNETRAGSVWVAHAGREQRQQSVAKIVHRPSSWH